MSAIILKLFIGSSIDYKNKVTRNKIGILCSFVGIFSNILLFGVKLLIGIYSNSISIIADSFNNLNDSLSAIISFLGFKFGSKTPDAEHPFGHGRSEYISALIISFLIMLFGWELFKVSISTILNPKVLNFNLLSFSFLSITILIKVWLGFFNLKLGKQINSLSLLATSKDSFNDVLVTSITLIGLAISHFTGYVLDGYLGVIVSLFIFYSGFSITKDTFSLLIGECIDPVIANEIINNIQTYNKVIGVHDLIVHSYGSNCHLATIHVELPSNMSLEDSHNLVDKIELDTSEHLGIHLTVHIDPVDLNNDSLNHIHLSLKNFMRNHKYNLTFSDLRIVSTDTANNIILNLTIPLDIGHYSATQLKNEICAFLKSVDNSYNCIININNNFSTML